MGRKDASEDRRVRGWKSLLSMVTGAVILLAGVAGVRHFMGPGAATAQSPQTRGGRVAAPTGRPVGSNTGQTRQPARVQAAPRPANQTRAGQAAANPGTAAGVAADQNAAQQNISAVVNGQPITRKQLADECMRRYGQEVLESIVNKHLIMQECQLRGVTITNQDVENEVDDMATKFGLSKDRWLKMLESEREIQPDQYRREIVWPTLALRRLAAQSIVVNTEELREAYEARYGRSVRVRVISTSTQEKANQLLRKAQAAPDSFGDLAKQFSEDTNSAAARGVIPPIRRHVGNEEVEKVAFALKPGEISRVINVANQYLILKCEEQVKETYIAGESLELVKQQLHDQIRDNKLRDAAPALFKELQQRAKVVNVFNNPALRQQMPGVAATVNNRQITLDQLAEECFLRHGKDVLEGEINRSVLLQELKRQNRSVTDRAIDEEIARAADAYGYLKPDNSPDVEAWLKSVTEADGVTVDLYVRDAVWPSVALKTLVGNSVQITQEDLDRGFASNYGERVKVLVIVLGNERQAHQVWKEAREANTDEAFGKLAHEYSIEPVSRANFGKVPPVRKFGGQPIVEEEAFRLKQGELSQILVVGDKHIIMRCVGRTKPVEVDRQVVEAELHKDILEKKLRLEMAKEFDRLKVSAQIDNFLAGTSQTGGRQVRAMGPSPAPRAAADQGIQRTSFQNRTAAGQATRPAAAAPRR